MYTCKSVLIVLNLRRVFGKSVLITVRFQRLLEIVYPQERSGEAQTIVPQRRLAKSFDPSTFSFMQHGVIDVYN